MAGAPPEGGRRKKPGPSLAFSVIVLVLGVVVAVPSIIQAVVPFVRTFASTPSHLTPGVAHLHLSSGDYRVFERTGTRTRAGGVTFGRNQSVTIEPRDVRVTRENGDQIGVGFPRTTETITRGSREYTAAVAFRITDGDNYDVAVAPPSPTEIIISRSLGDTFKQSAPWIGATAFAGLVVVAGIVLLIVGLVRRSRANRAMYAPATVGVPGMAAP